MSFFNKGWQAATAAKKRPPAPEVRRALDPVSHRPFKKPNLMQRTLISMLDRLFQFVMSKWLSRRILSAALAFAAVIGAQHSDAEGAAAFVVAAVVFGYDIFQAWLRRRFITPDAPAAPASPPADNK